MSTTFAAVQMPQPTGWRTHTGRACPAHPLALVKVQFAGETVDDAERFRARPAYEWDWMRPVMHRDIIAWRPADELTVAQRVIAHTAPWFDGMASPFMQRFIFGSLTLAAATFVAMVVVMIS